MSGSTLFELNTNLETEYVDFLRDALKLIVVSTVFYLLQNEILNKPFKLVSDQFVNMVALLILGLSVYHLVVRKLSNLF